MVEEYEEYDEEESEQNVYHEETREDLVENDELSPEEEGFMQGYDEAEEESEEREQEE